MERKINQAMASPPNAEVSREEKEQLFRPETFPEEHEPDPLEKVISQRHLINKLNNLNFQDRAVKVVFRHKIYRRSITLQARPMPCSDARLVCQWIDEFNFNQLTESYLFEYLYVPKGQQFLEVIPEITSIDDQQIVFALPETCTEISSRKAQRDQCRDVSAYLFQNGATYFGSLIDCSPSQFRVCVQTLPPQTFRWIEEQVPVTIIFTKAHQTLYSGQCRIIRHDQGLQQRHFLLEPTQNQVRRFPPREFRSSRHKLTPPPDVIFDHPLFDRKINLKAYDLSGSGFSVDEEPARAVLLPGLIIPALDLVFGDGACFRCMAQVVYCNPLPDGCVPLVRCGLTILDMTVADHVRLLGLMHQATDARTYICNKVDMDALWDFFFETGFIYPQKYAFIQANKAKIRATYEKLYNSTPSVATHFIYQQNGRILAHAATMRFYDASWILHHHAAIRSANNRGGLTVLNQSGRFINESHRLYSMKMDYVLCYFRPENKFPNHVFGGAARNINDPRICSLDLFAYCHYHINKEEALDLPDNWRLEALGTEDLFDLKTFYEGRSNGLMLDGLHLSPDRFDCSELIETFRRIGLKRERHLLALRYRDRLCAVVMANVSDLGLNMSDLTNSITLLVVDGRQLDKDILQAAVNQTACFYETPDVPVLIYPQEQAQQMGLNSEKSYNLWVYDTKNLDYYFRFLKRLLKFIQH